MKAFKTQYFGPTSSRGARMRATCDAGSVTIPYDPGLNELDNHEAAMRALQTKLEWTYRTSPGWIGNVCYHVCRID